MKYSVFSKICKYSGISREATDSHMQFRDLTLIRGSGSHFKWMGSKSCASGGFEPGSGRLRGIVSGTAITRCSTPHTFPAVHASDALVSEVPGCGQVASEVQAVNSSRELAGSSIALRKQEAISQFELIVRTAQRNAGKGPQAAHKRWRLNCRQTSCPSAQTCNARMFLAAKKIA